jgi:hypothetical protein
MAPPTILQKRAFSRGRCRFVDAEEHADAVPVNLDPFDQGPDQIAPAEPVEMFKTRTHFHAERFQPPNDQLELGVLLGLRAALHRLGFQRVQTFFGAADADQ